jgi:hypothetical protein
MSTDGVVWPEQEGNDDEVPKLDLRLTTPTGKKSAQWLQDGLCAGRSSSLVDKRSQQQDLITAIKRGYIRDLKKDTSWYKVVIHHTSINACEENYVLDEGGDNQRM